MQVKTVWDGGKAFTAIGDTGYEMKIDVPEEFGGLGKGATPAEMLVGALSGCIGIDVTMILRPHLEKIERIELITDGTRAEALPKGFTAMDITFIIDGDIDSKKVWRAIRLGNDKYCTVAASLKADVHYKLILNGEESTPEA